MDDNGDAAESPAALLETFGACVAVANDGESALNWIDQHHPDIVFLDIGMPGMNGFEVARRIRQRPHAEDVLLVALTGWGQQKDRISSMEAGFDRHLVKPAEKEDLISVLQERSGRSSAA